MALKLSDLTLAIGSFLGNRGGAFAGAAGAAVATGGLALRQDILDYINKAGQSIGNVFGQAIPGALAAGAAQTGPGAVSAFEQKFLGISLPQIIVISLVGVIAVWIFLTSRR